MRKGIVGLCCIFFLLLCSCGSKADVILQNEESEAIDDEAGEASADGNGSKVNAEGREGPLGDDGASEEDAAAESENGEQASADADTAKDSFGICVYICGAVMEPGVYKLPTGGRVYQLLEMAGGFTPDADERSVNLAQALEDGAMVFIPTEEESAAGIDASAYPSAASTGNASGGTDAAEEKVNINTADADTLTSLNGIGEAKAAAIVAYREEHGSFQSLEEIMEVSGIGEGTYDKIKDNITL